MRKYYISPSTVVMCFEDIYKERYYVFEFNEKTYYLEIYDNCTKKYSRTLFKISDILEHLKENVGRERFREVEKFIFENI